MRSAPGFQLVIVPSSVLPMIASSDDSTIAARYSGGQGGSARTASRASTCIRAQGSKTGARGDGHVRDATLEGCSDVFGEPRPAAGVRFSSALYGFQLCCT